MLIETLIAVIVIGVCLYLVNAYVPMSAPIKTVLNVVVTLLVCVWLLQVFGITHYNLSRRW